MINCLVVDDEKYSLELLKTYIQEIPFLNCIQYVNNPYDAIKWVNKEKVDLIITDIEMPGLSGIQLLNCLNQEPMRVICTAHDKYAIEGYGLDVIDYLLKPVRFDKFLKAMVKAQDVYQYRQSKGNAGIQTKEAISNRCIFVKVDYKTIRIELSDILFVEGMKDYVRIHTADKTHTSLMSLKSVESILPVESFVRVHRSYIVSINKINAIERNRIFIGNKIIPISSNQKEVFDKAINRLK